MLIRIALIAACLVVFAEQAAAATYYIRKDGNNSCNGLVDVGGSSGACAWLTFGKATSTVVAGDTVIVDDTGGPLYDEAVNEATNGSSGNRITYRAKTDCVSSNGSVVGASCVKVRRFEVSGDYVTIQGFEVTSEGMTADANRAINFATGADFGEALNNYVHDTSSLTAACITQNGAFNVIRGNHIARCCPIRQIHSTVFEPYAIVTGVNDKISVSVQGGAAQTVTLTAGAARTSAQISAEIAAAIPDVTVCGESAEGLTGCPLVPIRSETRGVTSMIELLAIANNAYTTLGMTVGVGEWVAGASGVAGSSASSDWLIENNVITYTNDGFLPGTAVRTVFRDNQIGPNFEWDTTHFDAVQTAAGTAELLLDGTLLIDSTGPDSHGWLFQAPPNNHFITRRTRTCRAQAGSAVANSGSDYWYSYNNTYIDNTDYYLSNAPNGSPMVNVRHGAVNVYGYNDLFVNTRISPFNVYQADVGALVTHDYSLWWDNMMDPGGANNVNADPLLTDPDNCDFTLTASSPAINAGGPLTTVAAADTGSGTTLVLTDARFFQDGWAGVTPDAIAVGTVGNIAQIVSIDYATGEVTISAGITRNDGDPVWWYADSRGEQVLYGSAPDIGASEFESSDPLPVIRIRIKGN